MRKKVGPFIFFFAVHTDVVVVVVVVITNTYVRLSFLPSVCIRLRLCIAQSYTNTLTSDSQVPSSTHSTKKSQIFSLSIRKCLHTQGKLTFCKAKRKSASYNFNMNAIELKKHTHLELKHILTCIYVNSFIIWN